MWILEELSADLVRIQGGGQFSFGNEESVALPAKPSKQAQAQRGPIASTASRYRPKAVADPFAFSEDDFYASRPVKSKIFNIVFFTSGPLILCQRPNRSPRQRPRLNLLGQNQLARSLAGERLLLLVSHFR